MQEMIRVGHTVLDAKRNLVAAKMHGSWCHAHKRRGGSEMRPVDDELARQYDAIPDTLTMDMSDGELAIINLASDLLVKESSRTRNRVTDVVTAGVREGLVKFGAFKPRSEVRDLRLKMLKSLRSTMVYSLMFILTIDEADPLRVEAKQIFLSSARMLLRFRDRM